MSCLRCLDALAVALPLARCVSVLSCAFARPCHAWVSRAVRAVGCAPVLSYASRPCATVLARGLRSMAWPCLRACVCCCAATRTRCLVRVCALAHLRLVSETDPDVAQEGLRISPWHHRAKHPDTQCSH